MKQKETPNPSRLRGRGVEVSKTLFYNMAKAGMNPKALQYLMGHSDIGVTLNVYTHLGLIDAKEEMNRIAKLA